MGQMGASDFKARCLRVLDDVARTGESVVILKRGRPVAELVPYVPREGDRPPQQSLAGSVRAADDLVDPPLPEEAWEALASGEES